MADATRSRLDLSTPDKARKALHDLQAEQKRLKAANRDLTENMETKQADLEAITKRLVELENRGGRTMGSNSLLTKYTRPDGSVRLKAEDTRDKAHMPGLLTDDPVCDWQEDLQKAVSDYSMVKALASDGKAPKCLAKVQEIARKAPAEVQRIFTDGVSGAGQEWIPDEMLPTLERNLTAERRLASVFGTINLPNKTTLLPYLSVGFKPYIKAAATGDDPSQYSLSSMTTQQRTITATGFAVSCQLADDATEDAIFAIKDTVAAELQAAILDGEEDAIVNGDTGTHQDTGLASWNPRSRWDSSMGGSADHRRAWKGLRAAAMDISGANTDMSGSLTVDEILENRARLDSPHGVDGSLVLVVSPEVYFKKILAANQVLTVQNIGQDQATLRTGSLGSIFGMPIIVSEFMTADLHTTGLYTDGTGGKSGAIIVNTDRWKIGQRRGATLEMDKDITRGVHRLVTTVRETFFTLDESTKKNLHYAFNISVT